MKSAAVTVRPWEAADFDRLRRSAAELSRDTLHARFHGAVPTLPDSYVLSARHRWPSGWDAVAAVEGDHLIGWAEYGLVPDTPGAADVAACVVDAEQGHGIGAALLSAIVERARAAGLASLHVDITRDNVAAHHAWHTATGTYVATVTLVPCIAA